MAQVQAARDLESSDAATAALDALEPEARRMAEASPTDVDAQYRLAAVLGARLDHEDGAAKIEGAERVHDQARRVLALAPQHPGASYMLGRIHASVLRMSRLKRFLATRVLGGATLKGASWEEAKALLEVAVRGAPCVADHHFELARAHAATGDMAAADLEITEVLELTAGREGREARLRTRAEEMGKEWRQPAS